MKSTLLPVSITGALLAAGVAFLYGPAIQRSLTVAGTFRSPGRTHVGEEIVYIQDTTHCEDLHRHEPSGLLFTACEDQAELRFKWSPPVNLFDHPELAREGKGSIHVVDPKTMTSQRLAFSNFSSSFVTHGIDVFPDPDRAVGKAVYIFAVNHVPNPAHAAGDGSAQPKVQSRIEIFHHVLGSGTARHVRSVLHPLIRTPNDIFAHSPTSFFVTNDHFYREGFLRSFEDSFSGAAWTEVVHVTLSEFEGVRDMAAGVDVTIALPSTHNTNGLGHGRTPSEILISSCASGRMLVGEVAGKQIRILDRVDVDSVVDNPTYFVDPFATPDDDRSGFLLPGISRAIELGSSKRDSKARDPIMVWYARPPARGRGWETRLLFEDDGTRTRSASAAILVAIDPAIEGGKRKAWMFLTGFVANNMIAVKVDL